MAHDKTRRTKHAVAAASLYPSHTPGGRKVVNAINAPARGKAHAAARLYPSAAQVRGAKVLANTP